jgi:hypothetical protein
MESVGNGKVHYLDGWVVQDMSVIIIALRDAVSPRQVFGPSFAETCDSDNLYGHTLNLAVGAEMKRGSEPSTHDSNSHSLFHRSCPFPGMKPLDSDCPQFQYARCTLKRVLPFVKENQILLSCLDSAEGFMLAMNPTL